MLGIEAYGDGTLPSSITDNVLVLDGPATAIPSISVVLEGKATASHTIAIGPFAH